MTLGRRKGSAGELEVAKRMEAWWRQLEPGCTFKRTPGSGGWSHGAARRDFRTSGDLVTTATRFPWTVEVKRREVSFRNFYAGRPSPVWTWWLQAQAQAAEAGLEPMLLFRRNREPWHMLLRADYLDGFATAPRLTIELLLEAHRFEGRWPRVRGARPVCLRKAEGIYDLVPRYFALPRR
jgi:hypothetical protein